jgi:excisionase family DNA binding protein
MDSEPLRATEAARLLGIPTRELLRLIYEQRIRYVMVDGIAHVTAEAIDEYRARAS